MYQSFLRNSLLVLLTILHFSVDGLCGAALATYDQASYLDILRLFALYNILAFGGQSVAGIVLDLRPRWLSGALALAVLALSASMLPGLDWPILAFCLGTGNCLFHAAGGSLVLRHYSSYAAPGFFVSSGALGLALGLNGFVPPATFLALCAAGAAAILVLLRRNNLPAGSALSLAPGRILPLLGCLLLLLACVTLRGFGGTGGTEGMAFCLLFPCVFALGKALGGLCCDRFGYERTLLGIFFLCFLALQIHGLLSALLLTLALNMTMPITLRLAHWCFPAYPGLIFGLAAGCLLPGAFLVGLNLTVPPHVLVVTVFLLLFAAGCLYQHCVADGHKRRP